MTLVETHVSELTYIVQHHQPGLSIFSGRVLKNTESSDGLINVVHTSIGNFAALGSGLKLQRHRPLSLAVARVLSGVDDEIRTHAGKAQRLRPVPLQF